MTTTAPRLQLITFDGEARSGKGTIVQATKDYLRDVRGYKVMLIDAGQVFRALVVAATRKGVDLDDPAAIDEFLSDDAEAEACVQLVRDIYHMSKAERDALLYTNIVSENSAKIGGRPLSQYFKDNLLKKWLRDAAIEGYEAVLLDGRALEEVGKMLEDEGLCRFVAGLYFVCDPVVGARRTLGYATKQYDELVDAERAEVDRLVAQIISRNDTDKKREVQPIVPPIDAPTFKLPDFQADLPRTGRFMAIIDTSADISKESMSQPIAELVADILT